MCIRHRVWALAYRLCLLPVITVALVLNSGLPQGEPRVGILVYYTYQSALWGLALVVVTVVRTARDLRAHGASGSTALSALIVGAVTLAVTITMLVYHLLLVPRVLAMASDYRPFSIRDLLIHYATPLGVILDWLLFVQKGRYRWWHPLAWLLLPLGYLAFALVRAELGGPLDWGGRYPYFFIDLDTLGWGRLAVNVLVLSAAFAALGYAAYGVDRLLGRTPYAQNGR